MYICDSIELTKIRPQTDTLVLTITTVLVCAKLTDRQGGIMSRLVKTLLAGCWSAHNSGHHSDNSTIVGFSAMNFCTNGPQGMGYIQAAAQVSQSRHVLQTRDSVTSTNHLESDLDLFHVWTQIRKRERFCNTNSVTSEYIWHLLPAWTGAQESCCSEYRSNLNRRNLFLWGHLHHDTTTSDSGYASTNTCIQK